MSDAIDPSEIPVGRIVWRCRRGMKELDVLLGRFARERYASIPSEQQLSFLRLLDLPDPVLADYLLGNATPSDLSLAEITRLVTEHCASGAPLP